MISTSLSLSGLLFSTDRVTVVEGGDMISTSLSLSGFFSTDRVTVEGAIMISTSLSLLRLFIPTDCACGIRVWPASSSCRASWKWYD